MSKRPAAKATQAIDITPYKRFKSLHNNISIIGTYEQYQQRANTIINTTINTVEYYVKKNWNEFSHWLSTITTITITINTNYLQTQIYIAEIWGRDNEV